MPLVDEQQSYILLSLNEVDGQTIMTFQRSIQSCDDQDFHITIRQSKIITYHRYKSLAELSVVYYLVNFYFLIMVKTLHKTHMSRMNENVQLRIIHNGYDSD